MQTGYLLIFARWAILLKLLLRNGISIHYAGRFLHLVRNSFVPSLLAKKEKKQYVSIITSTPLPSDPLFIIGHWRCGASLLHRLFACDPQFTVPTYVQCCYPESFISGKEHITRLLKRMLPPCRPMDTVAVSVDEPLDDEWALFRMCGISPLERCMFPKSNTFFLLEEYMGSLPEKSIEQWEESLITFTKKLYLQNKKRIVFKNAFHTMRIEALLKIFPQAKFIHIYRDPRKVIPSTVHMWKVLYEENTLKKTWQPPTIDEVITVFEKMILRIHKDFSELPRKQYAELRFEKLEKNPIDTLSKLYAYFKIKFTKECYDNMQHFLFSNEEFKKNTYIVSSADEKAIVTRLRAFMKEYGYK